MIPTIFKKLENSPASFQAVEKLIVKNWNEEKDAGTYQCILNDANRVKLATLNVKRISGEWTFETSQFECRLYFHYFIFFAAFQKPQLNLTDVFYKVGERVSVNCDIVGFPASKVLWSFTPCENVNFIFTCEESNQITFNVNINQFFISCPKSPSVSAHLFISINSCNFHSCLGKSSSYISTDTFNPTINIKLFTKRNGYSYLRSDQRRRQNRSKSECHCQRYKWGIHNMEWEWNANRGRWRCFNCLWSFSFQIHRNELVQRRCFSDKYNK